MESKQFVSLHSAESILTHDSDTAYYVKSGAVRVFIVQWEPDKNKAGRQLLLCEIGDHRNIPSFVYRDRDYRHWRFRLTAAGETELEIRPGTVTKPLKESLLRKAGISSYETEGFENSLLEYYNHEIVKEDVKFYREEKNKQSERENIYDVIHNAFQESDIRIDGNNPEYKAVAYACKYMKQEIASFERINIFCGKKIDIPGIAKVSHIICRNIVLDAGWYKKDSGVIIGSLEGKIIACIPKGSNHYRYYLPESGEKGMLGKELAESILPQAFSLGRTLPNRKLDRRDLIRFGLNVQTGTDLYFICALGLIGAIIGVLLPILNQKVYDDYIPLANTSQLTQICIVICSVMVGNLFFQMVKSIAEFRVKSRIGYEFQDAVYYRLLRLPESFFRRYESADLGQRLMQVGGAVNQLVDATVINGFSCFFSLLYLIRMFQYSSKLSWISLLLLSACLLVSTLLTMHTMKYEKEEVENSGKACSKLYQYLNAIEKIRMAGVEDRAVYEYLIPFSAEQTAQIKKNRMGSARTVLNGVAPTFFSMVLYIVMVRNQIEITTGSFIGFNTALGVFSASMIGMAEKLIGIYRLKPTVERIKPILDTAPEDSEKSELPGKLTGNISLEHISFRYSDGQPFVLNDINIEIRKGEYLGIVGTSGCGKSTLLKLLLGFEKPVSGRISFDGKDLASMDKQGFRQNLGVVLQNGRLISGSIYENITITAPDATMKDVQDVINAVGLKADIDQMPMGIHTVLSENSGTISGGQQQRILIARAIIRKPSILIFDEATSALDNATQASVTKSLDRMQVTRIVVAHRLSTIRYCDRILVLDGGKIVEEGNFESLRKRGGLFSQLVSRQIAEEGE